MSPKKEGKHEYSCSAYPIATFMFCMYIFAFVAAVVSGGILIEASMSPFVATDTHEILDEMNYKIVGTDADRADLKFLYLSSLVIGSLSIAFSFVFLWLAVDLGIILFLGRTKSQNSYEDYVKRQMRAVVGDKGVMHRKK